MFVQMKHAVLKQAQEQFGVALTPVKPAGLRESFMFWQVQNLLIW